MDKEPTRLLESTELSRQGRALLEVGRTCPPVIFDVQAGAARFRERLATNAATVGPRRRLRQLSRAGKLGLLLLPLLPLTATMHEVDRRDSQTPTAAIAADGGGTATHSLHIDQPPAAAVPPQPQRATEAAPVTTPKHHSKRRPPPKAAKSSRITIALPAPELAPTADASPQPSSAHDERRASPTLAGEATPDTGTESINELRAIAQARRLVAIDPNATLVLLERCERAHPNGNFVEERDALRVLALMAAGQTGPAARRADVFLRAYPNSPFADRVRAVRDR